MKFLISIGTVRNSVKSRVLLIILFILILKNPVFGQELPIGYKSYFSHNCNNQNLFNFLFPENERDWMIVKEEGNNFLRIKSAIDTAHKSFPECRGILNNMILGDYILEFDVKTIPLLVNDTAGFCFLGPVKTNEFYYTFVFSKDTIRFFTIVNDSVQSCTKKQIAPLNPGWNSYRIERDILSRTIHITINKDENNKVSFSDRKLVMGYIGFGTYLSSSYLRNIRLWAPTAIEERSFQW